MTRKREISVAIFTGLGTAVATGETLWGVVGGAVGVLLVIAVDWGFGVRRRLRRLAEVERQLEQERRDHDAMTQLLTKRAEDAQRNAEVSEVWTGVWGGAFNEAASTGHILPLEAIMARAEVMLRAKGIDRPPDPPA